MGGARSGAGHYRLGHRPPSPLSLAGTLLGAMVIVALSVASFFFPSSARATDYTMYQLRQDGAWRTASGTNRVAQGFVSDPVGRYLKSVSIWIRNDTGSTGNLSLSLWTSSGGSPGVKVADLLSNQSVGGWGDGDVAFAATSDIDLGSSASQYFVVFQSSNLLGWKCNAATPTPSGSAASFVRKVSTDSGATWADLTSGNCAGQFFNMTVVTTDVSFTPPSVAPSTATPTTETLAPTTTELVTTTTAPTTTLAATTTDATTTSTTSTVVRRVVAAPASTTTTTSSTTSTTSTTTTAPPPTTVSPAELVPADTDTNSANLFNNVLRSSLEIVAQPGTARDDVVVRVSAEGLVPASRVVATVFSDPIVLVDEIAPANGIFDAQTVLPATVGPGTHTVVLDVETAAGPQRSLGTVEIDDQLRVVSVSQAGVVSPDVAPTSQIVARAASSGKSPYDAQAQAAATAALAMSAAAVMSLVAGGVGGSTQGSERRRESRGKVASFVSKKLKPISRDGHARGDESRTWKLPFTPTTDGWSRSIPATVGRYSAVLPRIAVDGSWLRASTGSLFAVLWGGSALVGVIVGVTGPEVVAPSVAAVLALSCVGLLDAGAGFAAWVGIVIGALLAGNLTDVYDIRTLMGLAALFTGLSPLTHVIRPLRRPVEDRGDLIERVFDYAIAPIFVAFAASSMFKALNGLSGLELVSSSTARSSVWVFWLACVVRLMCEDLIQRFYPLRMAQVQPPKLTSPNTTLSLASIAPRTGIFLFVAIPFFGWTWQTILSAVFLAIPLILKPFEDDLPNNAVIHRWLPRGLFRFLCLLILGMWLAQQLVPPGDVDALRRASVWLLVPGLIVGVMEMFGRSGGDWPNVRVKWALGSAVWAIAVGVVSGALTLFS